MIEPDLQFELFNLNVQDKESNDTVYTCITFVGNLLKANAFPIFKELMYQSTVNEFKLHSDIYNFEITYFASNEKAQKYAKQINELSEYNSNIIITATLNKEKELIVTSTVNSKIFDDDLTIKDARWKAYIIITRED